MATASWVAAQSFGETLTLTYDTNSLDVTKADVDCTNALAPINYEIDNAGTPLTSGQLQPGTSTTYSVPAGLIVLRRISGPAGAGVVLPAGLSVKTWT